MMRYALLLLVLRSVAVAGTFEFCPGPQLIDTGGVEIVTPYYGTITYQDSNSCSWLIQAPDDQFVKLSFIYFRMIASYQCSQDQLDVYDGDSTSSTLVARLCGSDQPADIVSTGPHLFVKFVTRSWGSWPEVRIRILFQEFSSVDDYCPGHVLIHNDGTEIASPLYGVEDYPHDSYCSWLIEAPPNQYVRLVFIDFYIHRHVTCRYDNLTAYDGSSSSSAGLGVFCCDCLPADIVSTGRYLYLVFQSNVDEWQWRGFKSRVQFEESTSGVPAPGSATGSDAIPDIVYIAAGSILTVLIVIIMIMIIIIIRLRQRQASRKDDKNKDEDKGIQGERNIQSLRRYEELHGGNPTSTLAQGPPDPAPEYATIDDEYMKSVYLSN